MIRARRYAGEQGLTLMELLLTIAILGIISVPLTNAMVAGLRTTDKTTTRLTDGNSADFVAAYFGRDVRNSVALSESATSCTGGAGGKLNVDAGGGRTISYSSPTGVTLVRTECPSSGPATSKTLASDLDPAHQPTVTPDPAGNIANWRTLRLDLTTKSGYNFHLNVTRRTT